jgi:hypothetical protein
MAAHLLTITGFAGAQDGDDAVTGVGVVDMDWQKAAFVVARVEQRQLLRAMHGVSAVSSISRVMACGAWWSL